MAKRMDALQAIVYKDRDGNEKTRWSRVGVAFETKSGGWQVLLDAMPVPTDGQYKITLMIPQEKEGF